MKKLLAILLIITVSFLSNTIAQESNIVTNRPSLDTAEITASIKSISKLRHVATDSSIGLLLEIYHKSREANYVKGIAASLINLGLMYMDKGEYDKSLAFYTRAIPYAQLLATEKPKSLILLYNNIAALYGNRNVYDTAAIYYYKALEQYDNHKLSDTSLLLTIYNNLIARLTISERMNEAWFYLQKAYPLALALRNNQLLAKTNAQYSGFHIANKNIDSTRLYANKALQILDTLQDPSSSIVAHCNLAETYLLENNPRKALEIYNKAIKENNIASKLALVPAYKGLAKCYFDLKDYTKAESYYLLVLEESKKVNSFSVQKDVYKTLVDIYTSKKDYKKALEYYNRYVELMELNINEEKNKTFGQLEVKYRTAQKDKELAGNKLLLSEQSRQLQNKNALLITICICSLFAILLVFNVYISRKRNEGLQSLALKSEKELTRLKATMQGEETERKRIARELHDGIMIQFSSVKMNLSALNKQQSLSNQDKMGTIIESLDEAIKELRKSAHNLMPDMLLKEGLTDAVHYFCLKLKESAKIDFEFQSYGEMPEIAPEYELMIYRMIQELMHNTIKHAKATKVLVQLSYQPDVINITVEDDGVGFEPDDNTLNKGIGLRQIRERIAFLNGRCKSYHNKPSGSSICLDLETKFLQKTNTEKYADNSIYSG